MSRRWIATILLLTTALVGCGRAPTPLPTPIATAPPQGAAPHSIGAAATASGEVVPARRADLSFPISGRVRTVAVSEGQQVSSGKALATLETAILEARVAQAQAALEVAQAQLALLRADPHPEEIAAATAQLEAARAALAQAAARRDRPDLGATEAEIASARGRIAAATADQRNAEEMHNRTMTCVDVTLPGGEETTICPALGTLEEQARFSLHAANAEHAAAQADLDALLAGADAEVRAAQASVWAAAAQRDVARAELDLLQATDVRPMSATAAEIAAAEAEVARAQAGLAAAEAAMDQATLRAPFDGTVTAVSLSPGETVQPGQVALTLADLSDLQVETTDLSEQDVGRVRAGQKASVYLEPLDLEIEGNVNRIASQASILGGDVVYTVVVELDEQPPGLRWGMSAEVGFVTE